MSKQKSILQLAESLDKEVYVQFTGGRQLKGTLKGYDELINLVLDDTVETVTLGDGTTRERKLGLVSAERGGGRRGGCPRTDEASDLALPTARTHPP